ncbi:hypothetical protein BD309DRAFT_952560 [Dichomitus squalens]|uniref:Uncharacterized protein n=1 Tax=Dichomitus squalens TaxID=114155 RepID=A0A4Q9Q1E5_9APHY|nr:hypothetical protein BD309DRAFT_952560 [Dichomitus squalens]TBU60761.1 hypothetical protein BD310DRAFT_922005 [Dichomitus squalens]
MSEVSVCGASALSGDTLNTKTRKGDARYTPYAVSSSAIRSFSSSASRTRALVSGLLEEHDCGMPTAAFASVGTTSSSAPSHMDWPSVVSASSLDGERAVLTTCDTSLSQVSSPHS